MNLQIQFPRKHFSLRAHSLSFWHTGKHMLLRQEFPSEHSELCSQDTGTKNHIIHLIIKNNCPKRLYFCE